MKLKHLLPEFVKSEGRVIAGFGRAKLIEKPGDKYVLIGGSNEDRAEALEWISLCMHEVVPVV
jgi:hypothetical protein